MYFLHVAQFFERIEATASRIDMTKLLAELFKETTPAEAEKIAYLTLGEMRAPYKGTKFNFAQKGVETVVAHLLKTSVAHIREQAAKLGDLGLVVAQGTWKVDHKLSVTQVYHALENFEGLTGSGSVEEKTTALITLLQSVEPLSACFIVRVILQKLRLGFSEMTLIDAFSWMLVDDKSLRSRIEYAYNVCADIGYLARLLKENGADILDSINITVGIPIRPAAAERLPTAKDIFEKLGPCLVQPKFDGFRLQVHIKRTSPKHAPQLAFFSRNLLDMSEMFPDLAQALQDIPVTDMVVEGEALAYDVETGSYLPFQETVKRKRKHEITLFAEEYPLRLVLFDLLYLNGESYLSKSEKTRYKKLHTFFQEDYTHQAVTITEQVEVSDAGELQSYFEEMITEGLEGVVVKRPDAHYQPGKRNFNWIKLKRSQYGALSDTIDAVILGYYHGKGKRASFGIGALLVGVYNKREDRFETIAKIGTGLSDEGFKEIKKRCDAESVLVAPHNVVVAKELTPDVWVSPQIVIVMRADEITKSPLHTAGKTAHNLGFALRFPRFIDYRPDKSPTEATGVDEIKSMYSEQRMMRVEDE